MNTLETLLVLQRSDLLHIAGQPARFAGFKLLFTDPGLLDEAASLGLQGEFRRLNVGRDFHARAMTRALTRATALDLALTAERERLWPGLSMQGWDIGVFYLAMLRLAVARQIGALIDSSFSEPRIGVLRPSKPQQMYFDSFAVTDLVMQQAADPARLAVIDTYDPVRWYRDDAWTQVFDAAGLHERLAGGRISAITHVPTCFYDRAWIADEVARVHGYTLDLPSPLWDVPIHRGGLPMLPLEAALGSPRTRAYREAATRVLDAWAVEDFATPRARQVQVAAWSQRCAWQAAQFEALQTALAGTRPGFLISDQDTGLNGPLFSVAHALGAPITVMPHSGHASMRLPHAERVQVVETAGYGTAVRTLYGQAVTTRPVRYGQSLDPQVHPRLRTVCLMLNSLLTEGLSYVDVHALAGFYKPFKALCAAADVQLVLRPKPGGPSLSLLCSALGVPADELVRHTQEPLADLARRCELVVAYGEPTTGVAPFLNGGSLVVQVHEQRWPADYIACMPLVADGVIALLEPAAALSMLSALLCDPTAFQSMCRRQNAAFDARAAAAHTHLFDDRPPPN